MAYFFLARRIRSVLDFFYFFCFVWGLCQLYPSRDITVIFQVEYASGIIIIISRHFPQAFFSNFPVL